jgi:hypothetical protein
MNRRQFIQGATAAVVTAYAGGSFFGGIADLGDARLEWYETGFNKVRWEMGGNRIVGHETGLGLKYIDPEGTIHRTAIRYGVSLDDMTHAVRRKAKTQLVEWLEEVVK